MRLTVGGDVAIGATTVDGCACSQRHDRHRRLDGLRLHRRLESAVSGGGVEGYVADDGDVFHFGYTGAFPVRLSAGGGTAVGATTVWGGFNAD